MIVYLDTSVLLRVILRQPASLAGFGEWERAYCSELLGVEGRRVLDRIRSEGALDDAGLATAHQQIARAERTFGVVRVTRAVLRRASLPMPTVTKTLDAIHLATALMLSERQRVEVVFATHDAGCACARLRLRRSLTAVPAAPTGRMLSRPPDPPTRARRSHRSGGRTTPDRLRTPSRAQRSRRRSSGAVGPCGAAPRRRARSGLR